MKLICQRPRIEVRSATKNKQLMHDTDQARISIFLFPVFLLRRYLKYHRERNNETKGLTSTLLSSLLGYILVVKCTRRNALTFLFIWSIFKKENLFAQK